FDWPKLLDVAIPAADADRWRDRRRAERAARQTFAAETAEPDGAAESEAVDGLELAAPSNDPIAGRVAADAFGQAPAVADTVQAGAAAMPLAPSSPTARRKRRRRRGA